MARSFAELEEDEEVGSAEVVQVLENYADSGAAINAAVVISLIDRTNPSRHECEQMKASAEKGKADQIRRRFPRDAASYSQVIRHLITRTR